MQRTTIPLGEDILLSIIAFLDLEDILVLRQVSKELKEITCHRSIWAVRYSELVREQHLQLPEHDLALTSSELEWAIRRRIMVDRNWRRGTPEMGSLRLETFALTADGHVEGIYLAPNGRWLLLFRPTLVHAVDLEDPSAPPIPLFSGVETGIPGIRSSTISSTPCKDGDSWVFFMTIRGAEGLTGSTFAFWSVTFRDSGPTSNYLGRLSFPDRCIKPSFQNDLFLCTRMLTKYILVFDWKRALSGTEPFRYYCIRYLSPRNPIYELRRFCLLENNHILAIDYASIWIQIFGPLEFQMVDSHLQPLPEVPAPPVWEYIHTSADTPRPVPVYLYPIYRPPHVRAQAESGWPVGALILNGAGGYYTLIADQFQGDCSRYDYLRARDRSLFTQFGSRAIVVSRSDATGDPWTVDLCTVNDDLAINSPPLEHHGHFSINHQDFNTQDNHNPDLVPAFDEESGRMCFLILDYIAGSTSIVVLDLI